MGGDVEVFLDTSVLFAAVHSEMGGARMILKLGEAGAVSLWVGPWVMREAEAALASKSPKSKAYFVLLIDRARIRVGEEAGADMLERALAVVDYQPDAEVLAEALVMGVDYFVSFDRKHLVGNPRAGQLAFPVGTPGDFLEWYRERLMKRW
ncbi:MAG: type II toxin-antitoxin system VapC family toxin [Dehalococcoidia bacterium]|nr:type II toxin-antitoxin system VapC family toxin [Dehalococcoidia bacterium]